MIGKFHLFKELHAKASQLELSDLKSVTQELMDIHNGLVEKIWEIKLELNNNSLRPLVESKLRKQLDEFEALLKHEDTESKLKELLVKINAIEVDRGIPQTPTPSSP
ncbi:hypothetical protein [Legionella maioricensis]|uniref:Uncharacterized protein n=1 Tax=Legionella maioricensis TaxID=2896528 RepID=A0A9X2D2U3_9GAMM|nr:hypothetical protein [Legionella maioricensis]MCL9685451.1 hypothetical protein [Legionella maioricensis]MCL9689191.1 hypothetical protein [Legionella maioricensis]